MSSSTDYDSIRDDPRFTDLLRRMILQPEPPCNTPLMYAFLDISFLIFHSSLVVFTLVGWIWKKTRRGHLLVLSLTMCSWFGLGIWYGFGYCPCTDWHWQVKTKLGETNLPMSYVKYYTDRLTGLDWNAFVLDLVVTVLGLAAFGVSIWLNSRDWRRA